MGDVMPNYKVEVARLKMQISAQVANIDRQTFEIMELEDRKARLEENIAAAKKAISELETNKKQLEDTHGLAAK